MGTQAPSMTLSSSPLELQSWAELGGTWRLVACSPRTRLRQVTPGDLSSGADVTRGLCNLGQLCKTAVGLVLFCFPVKSVLCPRCFTGFG